MLKSIRSYQGVPYLWAGDTKRGMDCSGFTMKVFQESSNYTLPHNAAAQYKLGSKVNIRQLKLGDLVFFRDIESKGVSHVGIYVGDNKFAHASLSKGVVYSSMNQEYYRKRYVSARRILK
ncbi:MAG: C40 family peptidase [Candidatus Marinimicrobia bacterium]|nr:C40 family peptidase [Candidatus Neomarinimicrobiota bacterium]